MDDYKQTSFSGGLNLLLDDTRLPVSFKYKEGDSPYDISYSQYRLALNLRTRFDVCTPVKSSVVDANAPAGLKQAVVTFGNYIILFVAGKAYYKLAGQVAWTNIIEFSMSPTAPKYWTVSIPLTLTNYYRVGVPTVTNGTQISANNNILQLQQANKVVGIFGNIPGLLVQDGTNQPVFLYLDGNNQVQFRITQSHSQWEYDIDTTSLVVTKDAREYVPVGTFMEWFNGILFIVDPTFSSIYRSVSGRPLDFGVNVDINGQLGGDASTTAYSIGISGITAMRAMPGNTLFVAAGGAGCVSITLNQTPNAPTIFGEYTFIHQVLFNANCITERGIIDISGSPGSNSSGDTVFIDANGLRSFNAILQSQNEGRNSVFSSTIQNLFNNIVQSSPKQITDDLANFCAAINFDNYAIFSVKTTLGYVLVVYDTINNCYTALDTVQVGNFGVKQFAAISVDTLSLFAITSDDKFVQLYAGDNATANIRIGSVCTQDPKKELKIINVRVIFTNITENFTVTCALFTNNRFDSQVTSAIDYVSPSKKYTGISMGTDIGTQTNNILFSFPNSQQGWKAFPVISWTGGASLTSVSISAIDLTPMQPLTTQSVITQA